MFNHAPADYICPICLGVQGTESDKTLIRRSDIIFQDQKVMAFIGSYFVGNNPGHVIVVPAEHYENLYDLPNELAHRIFDLAKTCAIAIRSVYQCEGVTTLQNNEPIGGQHAFHYHLHLFPRYQDDQLHDHMLKKRQTTPEEREGYAKQLRRYLEENQ